VVAEHFDEDEALLERISGLGIDLDTVTADLQRVGVIAFADAFDELMVALESKREARRAAG
jgi:hypothetical protein